MVEIAAAAAAAVAAAARAATSGEAAPSASRGRLLPSLSLGSASLASLPRPPGERSLHSLHSLFSLPWLQKDEPPQSLHRHFLLPCAQSDDPPQSLHRFFTLPWLQKDDPPHSLQVLFRLPWLQIDEGELDRDDEPAAGSVAAPARGTTSVNGGRARTSGAPTQATVDSYTSTKISKLASAGQRKRRFRKLSARTSYSFSSAARPSEREVRSEDGGRWAVGCPPPGVPPSVQLPAQSTHA